MTWTKTLLFLPSESEYVPDEVGVLNPKELTSPCQYTYEPGTVVGTTLSSIYQNIEKGVPIGPITGDGRPAKSFLWSITPATPMRYVAACAVVTNARINVAKLAKSAIFVIFIVYFPAC